MSEHRRSYEASFKDVLLHQRESNLNPKANEFQMYPTKHEANDYLQWGDEYSTRPSGDVRNIPFMNKESDTDPLGFYLGDQSDETINPPSIGFQSTSPSSPPQVDPLFQPLPQMQGNGNQEKEMWYTKLDPHVIQVLLLEHYACRKQLDSIPSELRIVSDNVEILLQSERDKWMLEKQKDMILNQFHTITAIDEQFTHLNM